MSQVKIIFLLPRYAKKKEGEDRGTCLDDVNLTLLERLHLEYHFKGYTDKGPVHYSIVNRMPRHIYELGDVEGTYQPDPKVAPEYDIGSEVWVNCAEDDVPLLRSILAEYNDKHAHQDELYFEEIVNPTLKFIPRGEYERGVSARSQS